MRGLASDMMQADEQSIAWFRYGATYALKLIEATSFYREADRSGEAADMEDDLGKDAAADSRDTIVRNLLRLGIFLDELTAKEVQQIGNRPLSVVLDEVRKKL